MMYLKKKLIKESGKMKTFIINLVLSAVSIVIPIKPFLIAVGLLITFDFVTGIWKAIKNNEKITSQKMSHTISKAVLYQLAIITGLILEYTITNTIPFVRIIAGFLVITESKSILENISVITKIDLINFLKEYLKRSKLTLSSDDEEKAKNKVEN